MPAPIDKRYTVKLPGGVAHGGRFGTRVTLSRTDAADTVYAQSVLTPGAAVLASLSRTDATDAITLGTSTTTQIAALSGQSSAIVATPQTYTVTLGRPAEQTYAVTWLKDGANVGTTTITAGNASTTYTSTWAIATSTGQIDFTISPSVATSGRPISNIVVSNVAVNQITTFQLTSTTTDATAPFQIGLPFRKGDVPTSITTSLSDYQVVVKRLWNDGSVKHAIISGKASLTANVPLTVTVSTGTSPTGTALTHADIAAAAPTAAVDLGSFGTVSLTPLLASDPFRTWISGPRMVECHYRADVAGTEMMVWFHVRLWAGGRMWVRAIVENGTFDNAAKTTYGPRNPRALSSVVSVGGSQVFSRTATAVTAVTEEHWYTNGEWYRRFIFTSPGHSIIPSAPVIVANIGGMAQVNAQGYFSVLETTANTITTRWYPAPDGDVYWGAYTSGGTASWVCDVRTRWMVEGWIGGAVDIVPAHDSTYLQSTNLVPTYSHLPSEQAYVYGQETLILAYTQSHKSNNAALMNTTGYEGGVGLLTHWDACYITNPNDPRGYRSVLANASALNSYAMLARSHQTKEIIKPSEYANWSFDGIGGASIGLQSGLTNWEPSHHPSHGYTAYLITGDFWYYETLLNSAAAIWGYVGTAGGAGVNRKIGGQSLRSVAWSIRTVGTLGAIHPTGDTIAADFVLNLTTWNTANLAVIAAPPASQTGYFTDVAFSEPWMMHYCVQAYGFVSDMDAVPGAHQATLVTLRDHTYQSVVNMLGATGDATKWHYSRFGMYNMPYYPTPATWPANYGVAWTAWFGSPNTQTTNKLESPADGVTGGAYPENAASAYWGAAVAALSYAIDHGYPGAVEGYIRLANASNYDALWASPYPRALVMAIAPRKFVSAPAWRRGQAVGEWRELPGSAMSLCPPSVLLFGNPAVRIRGWCGLGFDRRDNTFWSIANGGHDDYHGNEVVKLQCGASPQWIEMWPSDSSAAANPYTDPNTGYYRTGHPSSSHTYWSNHVIERNNKAMRFGTGSSSASGFPKPNTDGFTPPNSPLAAAAWDAPGTYPDMSGWDSERVIVKSPITEEIWHFRYNASVEKWTPAAPASAWSVVNAAPPIESGGCANAFDTKRNRVFLLWAAQGKRHTFDVSTNTWAAQTLTGDTARINSAGNNAGMIYEPTLDAYLWKSGREDTGGAMYKIDAATFVVSAYSASGGTGMATAENFAGMENIYNRFAYSPTLQGILYCADYDNSVWFLRTH